jgi:eukaryotic-like serine/threonine-protein kinase
MGLVPGTLVAGRYRIVRELGRGGMGSVYVAEHVNTGGLWALKVMHGNDHLAEERAARFRREARASARIVSENVVRVTDADVAAELDGAPFIVMELLDGEDLDRLLATRPHLPPEEVVSILVQVGRGLDKAHAAGVIHRDLKPENIFMHRRDDGSTIAKVVDFGISKVLRPDEDPSMASVTSSGQIMGTPLYMSPEQARGKASEIGPATDVWAIGLIAYRMLSGTNYWDSDTIANLFFQILTEEKELPSKRSPLVGPLFDSWFLKSCSLSPQGRFPTVGAQVSALSVALLGTPVVLSQTPPTGLAPPPAPTEARIATDPTLLASDASAPTAATSTGVAASVAPSSPRSRFAVVAAASVFLGLGGLSLIRGLSPSARGSASSSGSASTDKGTSSGVTPTPSAALVANTAEVLSALSPSSSASAASASPTAPTAPTIAPAKTLPGAASSGARVVPRSSASHAPAPAPSTPAPNAPAKKPDLFDTQK